MSGHSVSQNMKKPSRPLRPIWSSHATPITEAPPSRANQACDGLGGLVELCLRLVPAALDGVGDAVRQVVVEQLQCHRLERPRRGGHLFEHVDAVPVLIDHPLQSPHLPFDTSQALLDRFLLVDVARMRHLLHLPLYTPYGHQVYGGADHRHTAPRRDGAIDPYNKENPILRVDPCSKLFW